MGNFSSSALSSVHPVAVHADIISKQVSSPVTKPASSFFQFVRDAFKTLTLAYDDAVAAIAGSSVVISEIEECWYNELVADVNTLRGHCVARCAPTPRQVQVQEDEELASTSLFLGPSDSIVTTMLAVYPSKTWKRSADDDDTSSLSTEETDDESKCGFSDSEAEDYFHDSESDDDEDDEEYHDHQDHCCVQRPEVEYYKDDDDTVTKADRLLRLASLGSSRELPPVYVDDYLCPCGECPAYHRIACDVRHTVTWRGAKEQNSIIRVLQAFSTYNEVIGYHHEMIEAAEECLQVWLGDEDRAFNSLVMLYDEVPQLCA